MKRALVAVVVVLWAAGPAVAQEPGATFERVAEILSRHYYDTEFRGRSLPGLVEEYRADAAAAETFDAEREVIQHFLSRIPASHLALISDDAYAGMISSLFNRPTVMFGFELIELDDGHYVHSVLTGGPADEAGVRVGDRVLAIDGFEPDESERLDWRTDDAFLPDPPIRDVMVDGRPELKLMIESEPGAARTVAVKAREYTAFDASRESAAVFERDGHKVGYIRFWYIHMQGPAALLAEKINTEFAECEAVIIDLRGRGGNAMMVPQVIEVIEQARANRGLSFVAVVDSLTRSAKEAIAWEFKARTLGSLVGETTAGALLPAMFARVGNDAILMYPAFELPRYSEAIELIGVEPHVEVKPERRYNNGRDPLINAAIDEAVRLIRSTA